MNVLKSARKLLRKKRIVAMRAEPRVVPVFFFHFSLTAYVAYVLKTEDFLGTKRRGQAKFY